MKSLLFFLPLLIFLLILPGIYAQSIGISPASLEFDLIKDEEAQRQVAIYSNGQESFTAESSLAGITISPGSGIIDGEKKLIVKANAKAPGQYKGQITIRFDGNEGSGIGLNTGAMVKVLMNVMEKEKKNEKENQASVIKGMSITSGIVLVGLAGYFALRNQP